MDNFSKLLIVALLSIIVWLILLLQGCQTVKGFARDVSTLSEAVDNAIVDDER